jgi:T5orf172 domain
LAGFWGEAPLDDHLEYDLRPPVQPRIAWLEQAVHCAWDMRTPKSWTAAGWVYVLRQPQDRWYRNRTSKIGLSWRDPAVRAREMFTTAVARPLNVEFAAFAPNMAKLECDVHARLRSVRANETREVFQVDLRTAIRTILETGEATGNLVGLYLATDTAAQVAGDMLRRRSSPTGVWSTRFADRSDETVAPSVDGLRELMGPHLIEADDVRSGIRRKARRAAAQGAGVAAVAALLTLGAMVLALGPPGTTQLELDITGATLAIVAGGLVGFGGLWTTLTRRQMPSLATKAERVRELLETGARRDRRKRLQVWLLRHDSRRPKPPIPASAVADLP